MRGNCPLYLNTALGAWYLFPVGIVKIWKENLIIIGISTQKKAR
jgi:hypothetical protein